MMEISNERLAKGLAKELTEDVRLMRFIDPRGQLREEVKLDVRDELEEMILEHLPAVLAEEQP